MAIKVDALRVVQDPKYAASLSDEHWQALQHDPEWNLMVGEYREMVGADENGDPRSLEVAFTGEPHAAECLFRLMRAAERGEIRSEEFRVRDGERRNYAPAKEIACHRGAVRGRRR